MTGLRKLALSLAALTLVLAQSGAAKPTAARVKQTEKPVAAVAMDGPRVAYSSGGKIYVWNVDNGATSVVKGAYSKYGAEVAIAGTRVAWVTRYVIGNTYQTSEFLYSAPAGGKARLLRAARRYAGSEIGEWYGGWIAGAVGSGGTLAVSTWWSHGVVCTGQRLSLVTPTGLKQIATGPGAIMAASADGGRIAVLRNPDEWPYAGGAPTPAVTVGIYSSSGTLLREIVPSTAREVALTGDRLVVLTGTKTLEVYAWKTGTLLHTWPLAKTTPRLRAGHLAAYGQLATYSVDPRQASSRSVHVISLATGRDVVIGTGRSGSLGYYGRDAAMSARGLVYVVTYHEHGRLGTPQHGKLVFVPTAKLLTALAPLKPHTLLTASLGVAAGSAGGAGAPSQPRTLLTVRGPIYAFAQDGDRVAWVAGDARVRVRSLSTRRTWIVGTVSFKDRASSAMLALAGSRALWSFDAGGNSTEYPVVVGAPGHAPVEIAHLGYGLRGMGDGHDLVGVAGDGRTLAYGWVAEACAGEPYCNTFEGPLVVTGGGISIATWAPAPREWFPPVLAGAPPPALFAFTSGRVAVAAARASTPIGTAPRVAEDASVEVYDLAGVLQLRVPFLGLVRDVALSGRTLAVLLEQPNGSNVVQVFEVPNEQFVAGAFVPPAAADIATGSGGTIFRAGRDVYLVRSERVRLLARAAARPIGLSIEGRRIAWAETTHGKGRIRAVTAP